MSLHLSLEVDHGEKEFVVNGGVIRKIEQIQGRSGIKKSDDGRNVDDDDGDPFDNTQGGNEETEGDKLFQTYISKINETIAWSKCNVRQNSSGTSSTFRTMLISASRIRLTKDRHDSSCIGSGTGSNETENNSKFLGVFLPFSLSSELLHADIWEDNQAESCAEGRTCEGSPAATGSKPEGNMSLSDVSSKCEGDKRWIKQTELELFLRVFAENKIHPRLAELSVCAVILVSEGASDMMVFHLSPSNGDVVKEIQCELMVDGGGNNLLIAVPLSEVRLVRGGDGFEKSGDDVDLGHERNRDRMEIPSCPVCLFRIDPVGLGLTAVAPLSHRLCSVACALKIHCDNQKYLLSISKTGSSDGSGDSAFVRCVACRVLRSSLTTSEPSHHLPSSFSCSSQRLPSSNTLACAVTDTDNVTSITNQPQVCCYACRMKETLWVCLLCGTVGCGRYSRFHALSHYQESGHRFSLEVVTQRVWDYAADSFVQRNDLLACPLREDNGSGNERHSFSDDNNNNSTGDYAESSSSKSRGGGEANSCSRSSSFAGGSGGASYGGGVDGPKKNLTQLGRDEYEALLHSVLEEQARYYEGEISRRTAEIALASAQTPSMTEEEAALVASLQSDIAALRSREEASVRTLAECREQEGRLHKVCQVHLREQAELKETLETYRSQVRVEQESLEATVLDYQGQIEDLTANLRMMQQISGRSDLTNAKILGSSTPSSTQSSRRTGGKKTRRTRR